MSLVPWVDRSWLSPMLDDDLCLIVGKGTPKAMLVELHWYAGRAWVEQLGTRTQRQWLASDGAADA